MSFRYHSKSVGPHSMGLASRYASDVYNLEVAPTLP